MQTAGDDSNMELAVRLQNRIDTGDGSQVVERDREISVEPEKWNQT